MCKSKENFCHLIHSQFESAIFEHIMRFVEDFNKQYSGSTKITITEYITNNCSKSFQKQILLPSRQNLRFEFEAVLPNTYTRQVPDDRAFGSKTNRTVYYMPQCNNRDVFAWGQVWDSDDRGFNLLLLKANESMYGDWFMLINTNNCIFNSKRPQPFGFKLHELPEEITLINSLHIYNSVLQPLDIAYIMQFISERA